MQPAPDNLPFMIPNAAMWLEIVRGVLSVLTFGSLVVVFYFALRWFAGPRARVAPSWHRRFAACAAPVFVLLFLVRRPAESLLAALAAPFDRLTAEFAPHWPSDVVVGLYRSAITTLGLVLTIQLIGRLYWRWEIRLQRRREAGEQSDHHVAAYWTVFGTMLLRLLRVVCIFAILLASLPLYLNYFPRSRLVIDRAQEYLGAPAMAISSAVIAYLPDLGYLAMILILGWHSLRVIRYLFDSLESGALEIRGFHRDWASPTYRLARTLFLLFLLMVSYPYLPGSKSQFFQGFSVFVGALITFGSTGAIGNVVAGTLLTYTRAFRLGDMVSIGDFKGVVIEKSLLVTRLRTTKNEEVSIPNGNVLSGSVLNYSARAATEGLVLTVSAGIGYDVDWRAVHQLMIEGALATGRILQEPAPRVLQTALGDYAVQYELRAATGDAIMMWDTLSKLHQNVLDSFNRAGVEIMTPSILAHRDASALAVPKEQYPMRPAPGGIAIDVRTSGSQPAQS